MASHDAAVRAETPPAEIAARWENTPVAEGTSPSAGTAASTDGAGGSQGLEPAYRVLVVEDDRSQALFAQSVLTGAGIEAFIEADAGNVLSSLSTTRPDLILLDLHLKGQDGIELTTQIRQYPQLQLLPIVFLSGDPDPERQYEVLAMGGDDYLTKPIRPRHLIAAVSNRIKRARQQAKAFGLTHPPLGVPQAVSSDGITPTNPETGLPTRSHVMERLQGNLSSNLPGHLLFVEIAGAIGLRERFGYASFERLMVNAGQTLARACDPHLLARLNDHSFLIMADGLDAATAVAKAEELRTQLATQALLASENERVQLRAVIGLAGLEQGNFGSTGEAVEAAERAALDARLQPAGIHVWQPRSVIVAEEQLSLLDGLLEPAYQPIVAVSGEPTAQFQVLLRLRKEDGTLLPAGQVIPVAEKAGRITDLDHQVMEHALDLLDRYRHATPPMRLFVTQSPRTLMSDGFIEWLEKALQQRHLTGESLVIDIRLPDALIHGVSLAQLSQRLSAMNVGVCISQFNPSDDAIALLQLLPANYLRLAARFASEHASASVRTDLHRTQDLAREHNARLIAQQVEDAQAAAAMWMSGIDFLQGNMVQSVGSELNFDFQNAGL